MLTAYNYPARQEMGSTLLTLEVPAPFVHLGLIWWYSAVASFLFVPNDNAAAALALARQPKPQLEGADAGAGAEQMQKVTSVDDFLQAMAVGVAPKNSPVASSTLPTSVGIHVRHGDKVFGSRSEGRFVAATVVVEV